LGASSPLAGRFFCCVSLVFFCASLASRLARAPVGAAAALLFFLAISGPLVRLSWLGAFPAPRLCLLYARRALNF
jgi:hypothetical protein